ncbi:hypothetical protein NT6N_39080 [Oceaniferula spumae]|uniref:Cbb3-type cytochrome c oxidase subunit 3 n=1 Tax=Oceaniferula spumae TaxID=2979115 RepID=A0AAT9FS97_9BACT
MFKTIIVDTWEGWAPIASFALTASIFGGIMIRAWRMKKDESEYLSALPLEENPTAPDNEH